MISVERRLKILRALAGLMGLVWEHYFDADQVLCVAKSRKDINRLLEIQ